MNEGWGMTHDSDWIYTSDGTSSIFRIYSSNFTVESSFTVTYNGSKLSYINELEYVNGYIYANVYQTTTIVKIDINNGSVVQKWTFDELLQ